MPNNRRVNNINDISAFRNIINDYTSFLRENQRINRYIIENQSRNERAFNNIISLYTNYHNNNNINRFNNTRDTPTYGIYRPSTRNTRDLFDIYNNDRNNSLPLWFNDNTTTNNTTNPTNPANPNWTGRQVNTNTNIPVPPNFIPFLNPVNISPSPEQITNSTETITYSDLPNDNRQRGNICPISHDNFEDNSSIMRIRHCGHYFMANSLQQHFRTSVRCPLCRYDIREYSNNTDNSYNDLNNTNLIGTFDISASNLINNAQIVNAITQEMQNIGEARLQGIDNSNNQLSLTYSLSLSRNANNNETTSNNQS